MVFLYNQWKKIYCDVNSTARFKFIIRNETELKWIKSLQTPFPLGFNNNIYHEGNISIMPDFDIFSLLECRKRKTRSHSTRKNGNYKRKLRAFKRNNTRLKWLSIILLNHGRHSMLAFLSSLPISVLRVLDNEANKFYDISNQLYDAALLIEVILNMLFVLTSILNLITNVIISRYLSLIEVWIL